MSKLYLRDLARAMRLATDDLVLRLESIGIQIDGDSEVASLDLSVIQRALRGELPQNRPELPRKPKARASHHLSEESFFESDDGEPREIAKEFADYFEWRSGYEQTRAEEGIYKLLERQQARKRKDIRHRRATRHFVALDDLRAFEDGLRDEYQEIIHPVNPPVPLIHAVGQINTEILRHLKKAPGDVRLLSPRQFEELIAEILASYGWSVQLTPATKDGGYDIFAINRDPSGLEAAWLVECKKHRGNRPVGVEIVRSFWAVKSNLRVPNGLIATTSYFTKGAMQFKESRYDLALKDFEAIVEWINMYRPHSEGRIYLRDDNLSIGRDRLDARKDRTPNPNAVPDVDRSPRGRRR